MASPELRGPYLGREALRLILAPPEPCIHASRAPRGLEYHYFHVDTAPMGVSLLSWICSDFRSKLHM